jgi:nucleoside-diphosphate-sugar epimerase
LVANVIALLGKPTINATNIGSNLGISIFDLATIFSRIFDLPLKMNSDSGSGFSSYYPSTTKSETWLGIKQQVFIEDTLIRWRDWLNT